MLFQYKFISLSLATYSIITVLVLMSEPLFAQSFEAVETVTGMVNHNPLGQHDFNGDGIKDNVICNGAKLLIVIKSGKDNTDIYRWQHSNPNVNSRFSGCEVVEIKKGYPSVIVSAFKNIEDLGARGTDPQRIVYNNNGSLSMKMVKARNGGNFVSAARSVQCIRFPQILINKGKQQGKNYKEGALCFWAGYDSLLPHRNNAYGTATALVKIEDNNGVPKFIDLTNSSGLMWTGGTLGTGEAAFTYKVPCSGGAGRADGLHMMAGTFLDYNRDGYLDLITAGQHASIRYHRMIFDSTKSQGFRFANGMVTDARYDMTEFLKVISFSKLETSYPSTCFYVSGERENDCRDTPDHYRCFEAGQWVQKQLPGNDFSSNSNGAYISGNGGGSLFLKAREVANNQFQDVYFKAKFVGALKGYGNAKKVGDKIRVTGWTCKQNTNRPMNIIVSSKSLGTQGRKVYLNKPVNKNSNANILEQCMANQSRTFSFNFDISINNLDKTSNKLYFYGRSTNNNETVLLRTMNVPQ